MTLFGNAGACQLVSETTIGPRLLENAQMTAFCISDASKRSCSKGSRSTRQLENVEMTPFVGTCACEPVQRAAVGLCPPDNV